jgi:hypothetical protein
MSGVGMVGDDHTQMIPDDVLGLVFHAVHTQSATGLELLASIPFVCARWRRVCRTDLPPVFLNLCHWSERITDDVVCNVLCRYHSVIGVNLYFCRHVTDACMKSMAHHCPLLEGVQLYGCTNVTDNGLNVLAQTCHCIKMVSIQQTQITDAGLQSLAKTNAGVYTLNLGNDSAVTDVGFGAICEANCNLEHVQLDRFRAASTGITSIGLSVLALSCPSLVTLSLTKGLHLTDAAAALIGERCPKLEDVHFRGCKVSDVGAASLVKGCAHMKRLNFGNCAHVGALERTMAMIGRNCRSLSHVNLMYCAAVTDNALTSMSSGCAHLVELNLDGCNAISDVALASLGEQCHLLERLNLTFCTKVTDAGVITLSLGCRRLHEISLQGCHMVTDAGIEAMASKCQNMTNLNLTQCGITDSALANLSGSCPLLTHLDVYGCDALTNTGVCVVVLGCAHLAHMNLMCCPRITSGVVEYAERRGVRVTH